MSESEAAVLRYSFSGHETFPLRYTWLPKAVSALGDYPDLFGRDDAIGVLGVGKNMVRSIRHWADAVDVVEQGERPGTWQPTEFGIKLFGGAEAWDPYFEDPATAWLLHWKLVTRRERASLWFLAFTVLSLDHFTKDELIDRSLAESRKATGCRVTRASLKRDVDVLIRTYVPSAPKRTMPLEDTFDSPLVGLGLIEETGRKMYRFRRGPKPSLPREIVQYAVLEHWRKVASERESISFEALMHEPGSPGRAFQLSESALAVHLERFPRMSGIRFDETAGVRQLLSAGPITESRLTPRSCLDYYYGRSAR